MSIEDDLLEDDLLEDDNGAPDFDKLTLLPPHGQARFQELCTLSRDPKMVGRVYPVLILDSWIQALPMNVRFVDARTEPVGTMADALKALASLYATQKSLAALSPPASVINAIRSEIVRQTRIIEAHHALSYDRPRVWQSSPEIVLGIAIDKTPEPES